MPAAPQDGLFSMGHCENERFDLEDSAFLLVVILIVFPFLLHIMQLILSCCDAVPLPRNSFQNDRLLIV